ncbi:DUF1776-domain-containing protein [Polychaeton citri CBS 116435]|uniref:DUF1776-domain-containing protein n=1 Tax=Polychaeton citri CBS 116435 TaxID=1314669 RepID=A0A9P4Q7K3_9PEZI|nr:DUF1776-domain-containing protein [Polychaeton citri CBS 116435]
MTDAQHLFDSARRQFDQIAADVERHFELVADHLNHVSAVAYNMNVGGIAGKRKRRAHRSASGARTDVVVIAGNFASPLANNLALDLERRGFIVYVVASSPQEEHYIRAQNRADLLPLHVPVMDGFAAHEQLSKFKTLLSRQHVAFEGAEPHKLNFVGLVLVPDTAMPEATIEDQNLEECSDMLNANVLNTIATVQYFMPAIVEHKTNVLLLTPSVTPSLALPEHTLECTIYGALGGFVTSLASELKRVGASVTHLKLGSIDIPSLTSKQRREGQRASRLRATPLRVLHNAVFDTLKARSPSRTRHIGRGSLAYDIIGNLAPPSLVTWMMGKRRAAAVTSSEPITMRDDELADSQASITWDKVGEGSDQEA